MILKLSFIFLKTKNYKLTTLMAITYSAARKNSISDKQYLNNNQQKYYKFIDISNWLLV